MCSCHTAKPLPVIPLSHTVVEPFAVVIKATHTLVARSTVLRFGTPAKEKVVLERHAFTRNTSTGEQRGREPGNQPYLQEE